MRHVVGSLAPALVLALVLALTAGCGSSPSSDPSGARPWTPGPIPGATVLPLISQTGAGGLRTTTAVPLDTPAQVAGFASQFRVPGLGDRIRAAIRPQLKAPGHRIVGQVVAVGCDVPPHASVVADKQGDVVLTPQQVAGPLEECLAPVTTVAIAVLPQQ